MGFEGEYMVEEMVWRTNQDFVPHESPHYTDIEAAKYAARAIVMHGSLGFTAGCQLLPRYYVIRNAQSWRAPSQSLANRNRYSNIAPNVNKVVDLTPSIGRGLSH